MPKLKWQKNARDLILNIYDLLTPSICDRPVQSSHFAAFNLPPKGIVPTHCWGKGSFFSRWSEQSIMKTRQFKYTEKFTTKNENFSDKKLWYISYFCSKQRLRYSLEPPRRGGSNEYPRRGGSNEYPQSMFWAEIRKIMYTSVNPSFYYIKVGF